MNSSPLSAGSDVTLSAQGNLLLENGEIVTTGNVITLISDSDASQDIEDVIELKSNLKVEATNGSIVLTGVSAEIASTVNLDSPSVTLNGNMI